MKKPILAALSLIIALSLMSCATNIKASIIFDEDMPLEQTAWISTAVGTVTSYNGITVEWPKNKVVQIPAGDTSLLWNINSVNVEKDVIFTGKNLIFRYIFEAEKIYSFVADERERVAGLVVYAWDFEEEWGKIDEHFVAFVPFENASSGRTVLE